jgi:(hydroxyamino)benzene mutase
VSTNFSLMDTTAQSQQQANRLLFLGMLLFLFGLLFALAIPAVVNPRMGLSAHLEGTMNGMLLLLLGLVWNKIALQSKWLNKAFWLAVYGSFANFLAVSAAAITGAGAMMPIAGGTAGSTVVEGVISFLLVSLALAMLAVAVIVLIGLYKNMERAAGECP